MITSILNKDAGFYSIIFFTINHFIYCKKNNVSFRLDSSDWLFKSVEGWCDYFKSIDFDGVNESDQNKILKHNQLAGDFFVQEYHNIIHSDFYKYNDAVNEKIQDAYKNLNITKGDYDAIFIRRGDKICNESKVYETEQYIDLLLQKHPECKKIFIQTDDYNTFIDAENYIKNKNLDIKILTLCDPNVKGMVVFEKDLTLDLHNCVIRGHSLNESYFNKISGDLHNFKPVNKMNSEEIYKHTLDMLIGIDIVLNSNYCTLDWQSNVGRFICVAHNNHKKVFDIRYPMDNIEMYWTMCPAYW